MFFRRYRFPFFPYCTPDALYFMRCTVLYTSFEKNFNQDVEFTITIASTCIHHIVYIIVSCACHNVITMSKFIRIIRAPGARIGCRSGPGRSFIIAHSFIACSDHSCIILSCSGSCLRDVISSFENILCKVVFTVFSLIPNFSDISLFIIPDAAHDATCDSRFVSPLNRLPCMAARHFSRFLL